MVAYMGGNGCKQRGQIKENEDNNISTCGDGHLNKDLVPLIRGI